MGKTNSVGNGGTAIEGAMPNPRGKGGGGTSGRWQDDK